MSRALIADIGGTHSRLALAGDGIEHTEVYDNAGFPGPEAIIRQYLDTVEGESPRVAALAVAGPLDGDGIQMINLGWGFSGEGLRAAFGFQTVHLFNDFAAVAMALPSLTGDEVLTVGGGSARPDRPAAVIGPGTGLGVAALVPCGNDWSAVAGEGGHVTLPAVTEEEGRMIEAARREFGHVSAERLLSGPGLAFMYRILGNGPSPDPEEITRRAREGGDETAVRVMDHFFALLGTVAGNLALTLGAGGGVYLAGGILPAVPELLRASAFRERFVDKGRYRDYLERIPTRLITREHPALPGLQRFLAGR